MAISSFSSYGNGGVARKPSASAFSTFTTKSPSGFGGFQSFGGAPDVNSVDGLLALAQLQGGAVGQVATELVHPTTSILSTVGDGLKNIFKGFINVISTPSEIVAGAISADYTIEEAMELNLRPSDVIFGSKDPNATTMQKVGSFLVRTAADILTDPLTYLTFGASAGSLFGARAASKISLFDKTGVLTKEGAAQLGYLQKVARQANGTQSALLVGGKEALEQLPARLKTFQEIKALEASGQIAPEVMTLGKDELKRLMKETIDAPLNMDYAKKALSNLFEKNPALVETYIDKGGIKYFGKTLLSGQRIHSAVQLIPGMTWLDNATEQSRLAFGSLWNPEIQGFKNARGRTEFTRVPPEFLETQRKVGDLISYLQDERIADVGRIMKVMKQNGIDPNGAGQFLMASIENGKIPANPVLAAAYKQLAGFGEKELAYLRGAGIAISRLDNHAPHILVDSGIKVIPFKMPPSVKAGSAIHRKMEGGIFSADPEKLAEWEKAVLASDKKLITETINATKRDGFDIFDDNIFTAHITRSIDNVRVGTMKQFVDSLAGTFARRADDAPQGWVGLNLKKFKNENEFLVKQGMADSQLVFHPAVAKKIEEFTGAVYGDEGSHAAALAFDRLQNVWKASVTSIFPAFHGRNALSNVFLNFNDIGFEALNPVTNGMAGQFLHLNYKLNGLLDDTYKSGKAGAEALDEIHDIMTKKAFKDVRGYEWTVGELREVMKRNNIAMRDNLVGQVDVARTTEEQIGALMGKFEYSWANPLSQNFKPYEWGRKVGNAVEGQARMVNFLTNLRKTGDVDLAVQRTKQFLFDYQNLTGFEKNVMKRLIPFYTFTRKNLEQQARTLFTAPGRTAAQLTALTTLGDVIAGDSLSEAEKAMLPEWMKDGLGILTNRSGNKIEMVQSLGTPIEQPFQALQPNVLLASASPFVRIPLELSSGYNFFHGKPISEVTNAAALKNWPEAIKDFVGYTDVDFVNKQGEKVHYSVALRPDRLHVILNMPITSRVISTMKQMNTVDVSEQTKLLQFLVGIKPFALDLELESAKREKEMKDKLEAILSDAGVGYELQRFIPKK